MNLVDIFLGPTFGKILDKVFPDPATKTNAQLELLKLQQAGEFKEIDAQLQINLAQSATNTAEAASPDAFRANWRPFIGWICGTALGYNFVVRPILAWISVSYWHVDVPPALELTELMPLMMGMLGLGGLRSIEKVKGVA